jgi:hypothetical protein
MDIKLLEKLKKATYKYKPVVDASVSYTIEDIQHKINILITNLYDLKLEKVTDLIKYNHQYKLIDSIKDLAQIIILLISEQNKRIDFTNNAIRNKDNSVYFRKEDKVVKNVNISNNYLLDRKIEKIVLERKNHYLKTFGYFKTEQKADIIIKKEFDDVSNYIDLLLKINELKYNNFDNYDPLINGCQNLLYELSQLAIVLMEADESRIANVLVNNKFKVIECYFIIMDFVNSRSYSSDEFDRLIDNIKRVNVIIKEQKDIGLLCNMNVYKQDEVHGIFIGDIEKFKVMLEKHIIHDIKFSYSKIDLLNPQKCIYNMADTVYNNPFMFAGPSTWEARNNMERGPLIIKSLHKC